MKRIFILALSAIVITAGCKKTDNPGNPAAPVQPRTANIFGQSLGSNGCLDTVLIDADFPDEKLIIRYTASGLTSQVIYSEGGVESTAAFFEYDNSNRLTRILDIENDYAMRFTYNNNDLAVNRIIVEEAGFEPDTAFISYSGNRVFAENPDVTNGSSQRDTLNFDGNGNLLSATSWFHMNGLPSTQNYSSTYTYNMNLRNPYELSAFRDYYLASMVTDDYASVDASTNLAVSAIAQYPSFGATNTETFNRLNIQANSNGYPTMFESSSATNGGTPDVYTTIFQYKCN